MPPGLEVSSLARRDRALPDMLFPLQDIYEYLAKYRPGIVWDGLTLRWPDQEGVSELRVEPIEHRTHDDFPSSPPPSTDYVNRLRRS